MEKQSKVSWDSSDITRLNNVQVSIATATATQDLPS